MVVHWLRLRTPGWQLKMFINGLGALVTGLALVIIGISKFAQGAWISILVIPLIVMGFLKIRSHYRQVAQQLSLRGLPPSLKPTPSLRIVIPVSGVHRAVIDAVNLARAMTSQVTAVFVELEPGTGERVREEWSAWWPDVPLVVVPSPYRSIVGPILDYLDRTDLECNDGQQAVLVMPEFVPAHWWQSFLHNQTALMLHAALLYRRRKFGFQHVIIDVPFHLKN
jgi:hypothetical protein